MFPSLITCCTGGDNEEHMFGSGYHDCDQHGITHARSGFTLSCSALRGRLYNRLSRITSQIHQHPTIIILAWDPKELLYGNRAHADTALTSSSTCSKPAVNAHGHFFETAHLSLCDTSYLHDI